MPEMDHSDSILLRKKAAATEAADRVESGMTVGLGTGSTAVHAISHLGRKLARGELTDIRGIPTSYQSQVVAGGCGIPLTNLDQVKEIDLTIDGADEVDPHLNLIKGGGAAHTREKIIATLSRRMIVVVDESKLVERLGSVFPVPVEVIAMAVSPVMRALEQLGGRPKLRLAVKKAGPVVTDQGNLVVDVRFESIEDPKQLELEINNLPGVLENGLFVGLTDRVLVGLTGSRGIRELVTPVHD